MNTMLRLVGLGYAYAGLSPVFEDIHAHLTDGWTGLVGANGAGKSTLLSIMAGQLEPTSGHILRSPHELRVALCPQRVELVDEAIQAFAWCWDAEAMRLRSALALEPEALERWETLSPGERKRWQVGAALHEEPDVLLLDEPTNHLDAQASAQLVDALKLYRGAGLIISHDRALLDALVTQIWRLSRGALEVYPGGYTEARALWERAYERAVAQRDALRSQRKATERRLQSARERRESAEGSVNHSGRMKGVKDHDARSMLAKVKASWAEAGAGREVEVVRRESERAREAERAAFVHKELGGAVAIVGERCPRPVIVGVEEFLLVAGEELLSPGVTVFVERDARLWLSGANGAGKSTLISELMARCDLDPSRVLYVPQELSRAEEAALVASLLAEPPDRRGKILQVAAALGLDPEQALGSAAPSPGMARKLMIARGLVDAVWLLVLDEPTNHLDAPSIDRLEAALGAYTGALVLVTHDEALARACTTRRLHLVRGAFSTAQEYATDEL